MDYRDSHRALQDAFDTRRLADRLASVAGDDVSGFREFIEARDMFFIATADADGQPQCSYKGGDPGFVRVVDDHTLAFPVYDGNGMFLTMGNVTENHLVGLLFIDFATGSRLRINGEASIDPADPLVAELPGARLVVRVRATAVFPNCRRYVHTHGAAERSVFVPVRDQQPPVPDWKRDEWFDGTLPAGDPALDPTRPSAPATPQF
ncbi:pyridoxamine 5'-phosphate oxidase family protein [Nocardioides eburneiflavus]|uniref:Pyridoxamine 5'-phosphate oxidase family protein n=1 Tax=Nocardioides eburneiflavus TaxID=2518372 RepID=A0A4Z1CKB5_9ACTN|nr:pyridoxamine 5'-phosphate oxidase family protein [Nocardioides eburneiflavus]TGN64420.1 pyridoxamine 5'-phosphate oxidase family protein [Nocardioides eburneiflavus]